MADKGIPIWPPYEVFYIQSMLFNTTSAVQSLGILARVFDKLSHPPTEEELRSLNQDQILNQFHNVVLQCGAISRYFWPARKGHEERAELLRQACKIDGTSALKNRDLRNAIEHFDEQLDEYLGDGISGYVFPQYVGPAFKEEGVHGHIFRAYYLDTGKFQLLGNRYDIEPLACEIRRVHQKLMECDRNGGRLLHPDGSDK